MRKIYPTLFNKFAVFILYGLLSVAVITLGQAPATGLNSDGCQLAAPSSSGGQKIIGYTQLGMEPSTIRWDYYDYINVIAYPKSNPPWNDFHPPADLTWLNTSFNNFFKARTSNTSNTKILLSIRNFDVSKFPDKYDANEVIKTIKALNLDGVDIEYPGMRGRYCKAANPETALWDNTKDGEFINFIKSLHGQTGKLNKILMLTAGSDAINGLGSYIDYLNIETYHYSFYQGYREVLNGQPDDKVRSNPNAPYNVYSDAYDAWAKTGIKSQNIIMGVDLGNTLQAVDSDDIKTGQTVESDIKFPNNPSFTLGARINVCPGNNNGNGNADKLVLFSFPWNQLATYISNPNSKCYNFTGWDRNFDNSSFTSWLVKSEQPLSVPPVPPVPGPGQQGQQGQPNPVYDYVSYEDFISLSYKLNFVTSKSIGGISISDISYDTNDNYSLVNYMQLIRNGKSTSPASTPTDNPESQGTQTQGSSNTSSDNGSPSSATPTNLSSQKGDKTGKIVGAVIGSIFGLVIIGGITFFGYKNRDKLPFGQDQQYSKNMSYNQGPFNQPGAAIIPNNSPRMVLPDTAAIPVAPSYVTAMFDFIGKEENDLSFKKGDKIEVLERGDGPNDWWVGRVNGAVGEFPGNYVRE